MVRTTVKLFAVGLIAFSMVAPAVAVGPSNVDITWISIANVYYEVGPRSILADGYITRLPQSTFFGGGGKPKLDSKRLTAVRKGLSSGSGILKVARTFSLGTETIASIAAEMRK